jgi:hypothetical protein
MITISIGGEGGTVRTPPKTMRFQWLRARRFRRVYQSYVPMSSLDALVRIPNAESNLHRLVSLTDKDNRYRAVVVPRRGLSRRGHSCLFINGLDRTNKVAVYHHCDPPSSRLSKPKTRVTKMKATIQQDS